MPKGKFFNDIEAPLSVSVWLAADDYGFVPDNTRISATDLLKSDRQLVLRQWRIEAEAKAAAASNPIDEQIQLSSRVASRMGQSIHAGIEQAWLDPAQALIDLGYPRHVAEAVVINKPVKDLDEDDIPVYMEIRSEKQLLGYTISGQFDFCIEGRLEDFKTTSVFTYTNQTNSDKYIKQGSIYRWLNQDIVTEDTFGINYIFTDWSKNMARGENYPSQRILQQSFELMTPEATESWIAAKLRRITQLLQGTEAELPDCNPEELWQKDPKWKYYSNPDTAAKGGRAQKNFESKLLAQQHLSEKGKGIIIEVPGEVVACKYCAEFENCSQKDRLIKSGELNME